MWAHTTLKAEHWHCPDDGEILQKDRLIVSSVAVDSEVAEEQEKSQNALKSKVMSPNKTSFHLTLYTDVHIYCIYHWL